MLNKLLSLVLVVALIGTLGGSSAFAQSSTKPDTSDAKEKVAEVPGENEVSATDKVQRSEKLKAAMAKLVTDSKAGKVALVAKWQSQPAKRNNLSKGTKIAIGVGIAVAVVAVILIVKYSNNER